MLILSRNFSGQPLELFNSNPCVWAPCLPFSRGIGLAEQEGSEHINRLQFTKRTEKKNYYFLFPLIENNMIVNGFHTNSPAIDTAGEMSPRSAKRLNAQVAIPETAFDVRSDMIFEKNSSFSRERSMILWIDIYVSIVLRIDLFGLRSWVRRYGGTD